MGAKARAEQRGERCECGLRLMRVTDTVRDDVEYYCPNDFRRDREAFQGALGYCDGLNHDALTLAGALMAATS